MNIVIKLMYSIYFIILSSLTNTKPLSFSTYLLYQLFSHSDALWYASCKTNIWHDFFVATHSVAILLCWLLSVSYLKQFYITRNITCFRRGRTCFVRINSANYRFIARRVAWIFPTNTQLHWDSNMLYAMCFFMIIKCKKYYKFGNQTSLSICLTYLISSIPIKTITIYV